jgi:hypothetical protein
LGGSYELCSEVEADIIDNRCFGSSANVVVGFEDGDLALDTFEEFTCGSESGEASPYDDNLETCLFLLFHILQ